LETFKYLIIIVEINILTLKEKESQTPSSSKKKTPGTHLTESGGLYHNQSHPGYLNDRMNVYPLYYSNHCHEHAMPFKNYHPNPSSHDVHAGQFYNWKFNECQVNDSHPNRYSTNYLEAPNGRNAQPFSEHEYGSVSRAVSSSFGDLTKNDYDKLMIGTKSQSLSNEKFYKHADQRSMISDGDSDRSWKALHQVASVDEENFNKQFVRNPIPSPPLHNDDSSSVGSPFDSILLSTSTLSNSSASNLIHSFPTPSKLILLNSLSTIASTQKPLETCVTYDSKTNPVGYDNEDVSMESKTRKRPSFEENASPWKKSRSNSPSSLANIHGPPCFTLSLDSMNSFQNDELTYPQYSGLKFYPHSKLHISDAKTSWDFGDKIDGSFTFDTCDSFGESSGPRPIQGLDHMNNQSFLKSFDISPCNEKNEMSNVQSCSYFEPVQEARNQSFDGHSDPRINNCDEQRDESTSINSGNRHDEQLRSWHQPVTSSYSSPFYPDQLVRGQNFATATQYNGLNDPHPAESRYPTYASQGGNTKMQSPNVDYRTYWSQYGYMYPHNYGPAEYWRMSNNAFYGKNNSDSAPRKMNVDHPKLLGLNKWSSDDDARLSSLMKMSKGDDGDFETIATELGCDKTYVL